MTHPLPLTRLRRLDVSPTARERSRVGVRRPSRGTSANAHADPRQTLGVADRLDVDLDLDLVSDDEAASFEDRVERQTEVLAVDRRPRLEPDHLGAVRASADAGQTRVELDRTLDAVQPQHAEEAGPIDA